MAIAYRSASAVATGTTSLSVAMPTGTVQNDIMIMVVSCHATSYGYSLPSGWTLVTRAQGTNGYGMMAWKRAGASEAGPYSVTGLADSCCGAIMSFSGCRQLVSPIDMAESRPNASGTVGTGGITTTENDEMLINACAVMDNLSLSTWATVNDGAMQERFDGRTTLGSDTGVGAATVAKSTAGETESSSYTIASPFENVGMMCSLLPQNGVVLTVADGSHLHAGDSANPPDVGFVVSDCSHTHVVDNVSPIDTPLVLADCSHAHAVDNVTLTHNVVATLITYLWTWLIASPAVGGIPGPKIPANCDVKEVSSYVTAATSVTFNIEERSSIGSAGTNILSSDQAADTNGESVTSSFNNNFLAKDNYLWIDISAVSGTPGTVEITLACTHSPTLELENGNHGHESENISLTQIHSLGLDDSSHANEADNIPVDVPILVDDSSHADESESPALTQDYVSTAGSVPGFWSWIINLPAIGGIPGPKIPRSCRVTSIQSYVTSGTSVTFNIEERDTIGSAGVDLLATDQVAITTGALATEFSEVVLEADHYLWIDVSATDGSPDYVMITLAYSDSILQAMDDGYHAHDSDNVSLDVDLYVDDSSHSVVSEEPIPSEDTGEIVGIITSGFYTWAISNPTVGVVPGPKLPGGITIKEISSYVTTATSTTFNIESRGGPNTSGVNLLSSSQVADTDGASATSFLVGTVNKDRYLVVNISAVSGTPEICVVTVYWEWAEAGVNDCSHAHTSDNITLTEATTGTLVVQDGSHTNIADNITNTEYLRRTSTLTLTVTPIVLTVNDSSHAHAVENVSMSGTTIIFLPSSGTPSVSPAFNWHWDETIDADRIKATLVKGTTALDDKICTTQNFENTTVLTRQYVLGDGVGLTAHDFTTSETFNFTVRGLESSSAADCTMYMTIDVYDITGTSLVGNIFYGQISTTELSSASYISRYCSSKNFTSNVSMPGGSVLVFGIGILAANITGVEYSIQNSFGDAPSTALDLSNDDTGSDYPYIEFPGIILSDYSPTLVISDGTHSNVVDNVAIGATLVLADCEHEHTSDSPDLYGVSSTLVINDCSHAHIAQVADLPAPSGRRLWVKVKKHWMKIAPEGT